MTRLPVAGAAVVLCLFAAPAYADPKVQLTSVEQGTVIHKLTGVQEGTVTEHWKDWGRARVEITQAQVTLMGVAVDTRQKSVIEGDLVTTVDLDRNTVTQSHNPLYEQVAHDMERKDAATFGADLYRSMGGQDTGETATYAGESCRVWIMQEAKQKLCVTEDGIVLMSETELGGKRVTRTAVEVRRGDPGPPDAYRVELADTRGGAATGAGAPAVDSGLETIWNKLGEAPTPRPR